MSRLAVAILAIGVVCGSPGLAVAACGPSDRPSCLYTSNLDFDVGEIRTVLTDPDRNNYEIPILIRYPIGAPGERPVVIWNHGGNLSVNGRERSARWGETFAAAGYVVIHPSRVAPNVSAHLDECEANGFPGVAQCRYWLGEYRFGPQTTHFLIDQLAELENAYPALDGKLDEERIVIGGHSAGSTTVLTNAGAWQRWVDSGEVYDDSDPRPIAFLASGPQGPLYGGFDSGFQSASYEAINERPFLFITGFGDKNDKPSEVRVTGWLRSTGGAKYLSWDTESGAVHETMNIHKCDTPLQARHCDWIESAGLAFLDAVVRQRPAAIHWLASDNYEILTSGEIELHRR